MVQKVISKKIRCPWRNNVKRGFYASNEPDLKGGEIR